MKTNANSKMVIVSVLGVLALCGSAWAFSGAGSGTEAAPYVITDVYQLQEMQNDLDAYYILGNDIDASGTVSWNGGAGFEQIGEGFENDPNNPFTGVFDGRGHTITGLYINRPTSDWVGMFGCTFGAEVKNVGMADVDITARKGVGALVNHNDEHSIIHNCWSSGSVRSTLVGQNTCATGGLVASNADGSIISRCYSTVTVTGTNAWQYGGLVGMNIHGGIIEDCYATGNVSGTHKVGGLVGDNMHGSEGGYVKRCYSTGRVTGNGGGLIGYNWEDGVTYDSYWDMQTSGKTSSHGGTGKYTADMMKKATFVNWDFDEIWDIDEGQSYPYFMEPRVLVGLEIIGPREVAEDSQTQYKAIAHYDNDSTRDVTGLAEWSVEPNSNCSIGAGLLTTEAVDLPTGITITAQYSEGDVNQTAEKDVSIFAICPSGTALSFDGVDDYVDLGNDTSLKPQLPVTLTAWIKPSNLGEHQLFITLDNQSSNYYGIFFEVHATNILEIAYGDGNGQSSANRRSKHGTSALSTNVWYHVAAVVRDATNMDLYINGINDGGTYGGSGGDLTYSNGSSHIGGNNFEARYFDGVIDEVAIYDRALSAEEIQGLMHTRLNGDEPGLVGYWDFDEGEGQVAHDLSGNGNDGVLGSSLDPDDSDPAWVESDAPVGICTAKGLVERNLLRVFDMKETILEILEDAIATEDATKEFLDELFTSGEIGDLKKGDVVKAKQKIMSAIQADEQAETAVGQSIEKLGDALNALGIE